MNRIILSGEKDVGRVKCLSIGCMGFHTFIGRSEVGNRCENIDLHDEYDSDRWRAKKRFLKKNRVIRY